MGVKCGVAEGQASSGLPQPAPLRRAIISGMPEPVEARTLDNGTGTSNLRTGGK